MKRKIIIIFLSILLIFAIGIIIYQQKLLKAKDILLSKYSIQDDTLLSMMIEDENGEYKESIDNSWPSDDYILNKDRSGCENGGTLEYQDNNVYVKAKSSDRCYVYFDIDNIGNRCRGQELANCLIANKSLDTTLIFHDGKADYDGMPNSNLEAGDLNYRYSGANPHNYVCLDENIKSSECTMDNLYRIIGLFKNNQNEYEIKLIKVTYANSNQLGITGAYDANDKYFWNSSKGTSETNNNTSNWRESNLNIVNLNDKYLNYLIINKKIKNDNIVNHQWVVSGNTYLNLYYEGNALTSFNAELGNDKLQVNSNGCRNSNNDEIKCTSEDLTFNGKIGLMYISDYGYAAYPEAWDQALGLPTGYGQANILANNWLLSNFSEWILTRSSTEKDYACFIDEKGIVGSFFVASKEKDFSKYIRPVFYLISTTKLASGSGTLKNPYRLALT